MGITGLWPILEPCCQPVTLESLEGKKLAVDVSIWIYQAQLGYSTDTRNPHIALMLSRLCKLLFYKIKPVFVFDGPNVPVFKQRVLEERRLKKFDDDILLNKGKRKHLEELARGSQNEDEVAKKLTASPTKKARREDEAMFNLPSTSTVEEIVLSDNEDDVEILVDRVVDNGPMTRTTEIERLIDIREQIRVSRLHPDMIPKETEKFCEFQLARVLGRNKINRTIAKLTKEHQNKAVGSEVRLAVSDSQGGTHVISNDQDEDVQVINAGEASTSNTVDEDSWKSLGLTLDYFQTRNLSPEKKKEIMDDEASDLADLVSREDFLGKSSMIEAFMKRRIGNVYKVIAQQDEWSSSDSGDDDFVDVDDGPAMEAMKLERKPSTIIKDTVEEEDDVEKEWSPEDPDAKARDDWNRLDFLSSQEQRGNQERDPGAYRDLQEFLTACGFPWIEAPGEAEAQCVELEKLGLVQGVVSDDSDVWAFGAKNVYRHLFSKNKNVQWYRREEIQKKTNLSQANVVEIAMISGGDYSGGLYGIGVVTAIELLAEFTQKRLDDRNEVTSTMSSIEDWLLSKPIGEPTAIRRKLRAAVEKHNDQEYIRGISNPEIVDAYLAPNVDSSREPLRWRSVDIDRIRALVREQLGWTEDKFDKTTLAALQKWNDFVSGAASYQKHITSYVLSQSTDEQKTAMTKRVQDALARLARKNNDAPSLICQATFEDEGTALPTASNTSSSLPPTRGKKTRRGAQKKNAKKPVSTPKLDLSESSEEDD